MKRLRLASGHTVLLDKEDHDRLSGFVWHARKHKTVTYAVRREFIEGKKKVFYLHREVMNLTRNELVVDHINHDGLDNRRSNLRVCTQLENTRNSRTRSDTSSGLKGVGWYEPKKQWRARIAVAGKRYFLGYFSSKEEAHLMYSQAAQKYFGQFAN